MNEYLFYFGFEDLIDREVNQRMNSDDQTARYVRILAEDEDSAKEWGNEIAEKYIKFLYKDESFSWKSQGFGSGIDREINNYLKEHWDKVPKVEYGEYPDLEKLEDSYD